MNLLTNSPKNTQNDSIKSLCIRTVLYLAGMIYLDVQLVTIPVALNISTAVAMILFFLILILCQTREHEINTKHFSKLLIPDACHNFVSFQH